MGVLYTAGMLLLEALLWVASLFSPKVATMLRGRKQALPANPEGGPWIWMHCASLGEFEQGRPVLESIKQKYPQYRILLSFYSPSGYEIRKNYVHADAVVYLPADLPWKWGPYLDHWSPALFIQVKYEWWLNLLQVLHARKIPVILISGLFKPGHWLFRPWAFGLLKRLKPVRHFFVQDEASLKLLKLNGFLQSSLTGDTRIDRVLELPRQEWSHPEIVHWIGTRKVLMAGSTWPADEKILASFALTLPEDWCMILAPHEIDDPHLAQLGQTFAGVAPARLSHLHGAPGQVLIIDNIGMLSLMYRYAHLVYIGGGHGKGIHNTLEPMAYHKPLFFGPRYEKFPEAAYMVEHAAAVVIHKASDLEAGFQFYQEPSTYAGAQAVARKYLSTHSGATKAIADRLPEFLEG